MWVPCDYVVVAFLLPVLNTCCRICEDAVKVDETPVCVDPCLCLHGFSHPMTHDSQPRDNTALTHTDSQRRGARRRHPAQEARQEKPQDGCRRAHRETLKATYIAQCNGHTHINTRLAPDDTQSDPDACWQHGPTLALFSLAHTALSHSHCSKKIRSPTAPYGAHRLSKNSNADAG